MNKYQEALSKMYWSNPYRDDYTDEHLTLQELVDGFSKIEAEIERIKTSRVPSTDYSDGYLEGLKDALSLLGEKEGK